LASQALAETLAKLPPRYNWQRGVGFVDLSDQGFDLIFQVKDALIHQNVTVSVHDFCPRRCAR
jgi:hypothetical protein